MKGNSSTCTTRIYAGQNIKTGKWSRPYLCEADWRVADDLSDFYDSIANETDTRQGDYADCVIYYIAEMTPSGLGHCRRETCTAQDLLDYAKAEEDRALELEKFLNATDEELLELINS